MTRVRSWSRRAGVLAAAALVVAGGACSNSTASTHASTAAGNGRELIGLFRFTPGHLEGTRIVGTWFRMVQPGGNPQTGPYMTNGDSAADAGKATLLAPGTSGGLRAGGYQSQPAPAFAGNGDSLADAITTPTKFFGVRFSISTNRVDPQTKTPVPPPTVVLAGDKLQANLAAWAASWNNQDFNQGAPKPVSSTGAQAPGQQQAERAWDWVAQRWLDAVPKATVTGTGATGTLDAKTKAFVLEWTSPIVGGPFNGFTGLWHLEGVYEPSGRAPAGA